MAKEQFVNVPHHCNMCEHRHLSAFNNLKGEELDRLSHMKSCVSFKKGQVIMHEGARPQGVYCLHSGKAKMYKMGAEGKEQIIRFMTRGDLIGYRSIICEETILSSISAIDDTFACYIPKTSFFEVIHNNPKFSLNILEKACHELGEMGKIITSLAQKTVRERLAEILLILRATFGVTEEGNIDVSLTREEIANMVGTATESAIRLISEFKEEKLIETKGRKIKILNARKLQQIASVFD